MTSATLAGASSPSEARKHGRRPPPAIRACSAHLEGRGCIHPFWDGGSQQRDRRDGRFAVTSTATQPADFEVGTLVQARGRDWVVLPASQPPEFLVLRPL